MLTREYPPQIYGGAGVVVRELSRALGRRMGVEVRCVGERAPSTDGITPIAFWSEHVDRLRRSGLDDLAIADVIHAAAFFNWANRLMLSLGEPAAPAPDPAHS